MDTNAVNSTSLPARILQEGSSYRVQARRDIITDYGLIKAGEIGLVPKSWYEALTRGGCSCKGSINWVKILR